MVKVSVIIPVYNAEKYLKECLDSVVNQSLKDIEIICIDDGSIDESLNILKTYANMDNRIIILEQRHCGGGAARNLGIKNASGEYLSFLDSDDYFHRDMLKRIYERCKEKNADIGIYGVNCYHQATGAINQEPSGLRMEFVPEKEVFSWKDFPDYIFNTFHNWPWNKLFKKDFINNNGILFQEINRTNDLLFTCKALILASRIVILDEHLIYYRIQVKDNCQSTNYLFPNDFYKAFKQLKQFLIEQKVWGAVRKSYQNHALDGCMANLDSLEFSEAHEKLYNDLKEYIFDELDLNDLDDKDVLQINKEKKQRYDLIRSNSYNEYVKLRADMYRLLFREALFTSYRNESQLKLRLTEQKEHIEELSEAVDQFRSESLAQYLKRRILKKQRG